MKRRHLFVAFAAAATARALAPRPAPSEPVIRPPGALPGAAFREACIGCFRCAEVCPPKAIRFSASFGEQTALPYLDLRDTACTLCMKCPEVCPTGALLPIAASAVRLGAPKLDRKACLPWSGTGVCDLCYAVCPYPDSAVERVGDRGAPLFHAEACTGCGLCEEACPDIAHAISIEPKADV